MCSCMQILAKHSCFCGQVKTEYVNIPHLSCYQVELEKSQTIQDLKSLNIIFVTLESNAST